MRTPGGLTALLLGAVLLGGCSTAVEPPATAPAAVSAPSGFYVDPASEAAAQVTRWEAEGRTDDAELIRRISDQPFPLWATGDTEQVRVEVADYVERAEAADARPLLVAYNIPHRDCGSFSAGGAGDGDSYLEWVDLLADTIRDSDATVVLEPDAVPHELSGCVDGALRDERYELLGSAIDTLKDAGATVYLDAGNPGFISDVDALAEALRRSGIDRADGFSLNVANFRSTEVNVEFGTELSERLDGARFVVDTSRNGAGAPPQGDIDGAPSFCNPPDRALGAAPTLDAGHPLVDALLWVKRPGESDGACRAGEPEAGQWYPDYALGLAERAS
ncbi:glycoside hydrolase family 6 protein [Pseudonocardia abyssalis]|nr:glycoside hydrolase family 6 protein [Pseudonocardia abyssalis]